MKQKILRGAATGLFLLVCFFRFPVSAQWTQTSGPPGMNVKTFYQSGKTLYAGTESKGVFKSKDHGLTWSSSNKGLENTTVYSLISDGTFLYAGTDNGVFRSS